MDANNKIEDVLATRILAGEATEAEMLVHNARLEDDADYRDSWDNFLALWDISWDALAFEEVDTEKGWEAVKAQTSAFVQLPRRSNFSLIQYAALMTGVIVAAALWLLWPDSQPATPSAFMAGDANLQEVTLSDGTMVTLNVGSRLVCEQPFSGDERRVRLSGEAWFDVAAHAEIPFYVETEELVVRVLGTDFNVRSLSDREMTQVEVGSGIVEVFSLAKANETVRLVAGDGIVFNRNNHQMTKVKANPNFMAWKTGRIQFFETPMTEVIETLERVYRQPVQVTDESILEERLGGTFHHTSFENVLEVVCKTFNLEQRTENGVVYLSRR
ncbi:FecR family protein [Geofilum rubicundum]|uniref:Putative anti-sigma factor n=1 Tax=Geofilum rubicundum JCM 15548 TaxID=1236989 RepID=A0A0E9LW49_9BACT|nr:FecR domain-containing protein [Geofilum rubicundum]GAO29817.1 putative anti-sigma factor [Geofilum rubicundum JCM 15548]